MATPRTPIAVGFALALSGCSEFSVDDEDRTVSSTVAVESTFVPNPRPRVDVLWVLDNTASMDGELQHLIEHSGVVVATLDELEVSWQMGLIVTETESDSFGVLTGNPWVVTPSTNDPEIDFAALFDVELVSSSEGAGLSAAMAALAPGRLQVENRGFRRENAALHVVAISDEDDGSDRRTNGTPVESFNETLMSEVERTNLPAVLSAIVGPIPTGCVGQSGVALPADRYIAIAESSGGHVEPICSPDLAAIAERIAETSSEPQLRYALEGVPVENSLAVWMDGDRLLSGWFVDAGGPALVFESSPPKGAVIRIRYTVVGS